MIRKILSAAVVALFSLTAFAQVHISTGTTSLVLDARKDKVLKICYFGSRLSDADLQNLKYSGAKQFEAYPAYGMAGNNETALSVTHADGNMTTELRVEKVETKTDGRLTLTSVRLKDTVYPFYVTVNYRTYFDSDVIETWTEIENREKKPVLLTEFCSGFLPIRRGDVWISHLYGAWANEAQLVQEPLQPGMLTIKNKDGVRNSHTAHSEVMFSLDGKPQENHGRVIAAALCYSGNYELKIDTDESEYHKFFAGINPDNSAYRLAPKEVFVTPELVLTYSDEGLSGASRNFHRWGRKHRMAHGDTPRKVLLNSWEGVYFDVNEQVMDDMMGDIASMGGELFVMDDGWFGVKYPRRKDTSSLGDWDVDREKLPHGIPWLVDAAGKHGIKFGIWIEPEMTNTVSELYEKHPDWIVKAPQREPVPGRGKTQLVLDLANPKVQDHVFNIVDKLISENPELDYIKWDANMNIRNHGSQYQTADNQSHLFIDYHKGFAEVCNRIRAKYPDITIQACAGGGGRVNYGVMPWFDEFWTSDNTDALQRVYIQWGTSYFYPAIAMASHISAAPNHQTNRVIPIKYRIDVAMSGRLGMEIQPKNMTEAEIALCRKAIAEYKEIRPVVQFGDIYRLVSPYDRLGLASLMYVAPEKEKAVFYWWKTETFRNQHLPCVPMAGLDPEKNYKVTELDRADEKALPCEGRVFTGKYLMDNGLDIPYNNAYDGHHGWASRVLYLEAQ